MAALRDALKQPGSVTGRPPHLRASTRPARSCASCAYYKALSVTEGACRLYGGARVKSGQVSDSWKAP